MRVLCVAEVYAWPPTDGYRLRLANLVDGLRQLGDVDVLVVDREPPHSAQLAPPEGVRVLRIESLATEVRSWPRRWLTSWMPRRLVSWDDTTVLPAARAWLAASYDLVYFEHVDAWVRFRSLSDAPCIVDFDNLENLYARSLLDRRPTELKALARWVPQAAFRWEEGRRWDRLQRRAAADAGAVLVCSELDIARSNCVNAVVVANGAEPNVLVVDHRSLVADAPGFGFLGLLSYPPNTDAARWFATEVFPLVRRRLPDATFRIVGRNPESIADLAMCPGVTVVGEVTDPGAELAATDVSVVPIRFGAGTRLKVIEALANGLPCVSTTIGAEGLDVTAGHDLLIADSAADFADACVRLVGDIELRVSLIDHGRSTWEQRYTWRAIQARLAELGRAVAAPR